MIRLLLKLINPTTKMWVSNLRDKIEKAIVSKFINNVKYLLDDILSNYNIIIEKGGCHED